MTRREFKPVAFDEPKDRQLRPLFVGRLADFLDAVAAFGSSVFFVALVAGGIAHMAYNLYSAVTTLAARGAWPALSFVIALGVVLAFYVWLSSPIRRFVVIAVLAVMSYALQPIVQRLLL